MQDYLLMQAEWLLRIIIAGICGVLIGYERRNRGKEAGIRTHAIVALASALIMVISLYGGNANYDSSRIAAQIVSGVGFLGAGMIFVHKRMITGLTTAAGVWATAGIGMAIGAGMYILGISAAFIIVLFQVILHKNFIRNKYDRLTVILKPGKDHFSEVKRVLEENEVIIEDIEIEKQNQKTEVVFTVCFPRHYGFGDFAEYCCTNENIESFRL